MSTALVIYSTRKHATEDIARCVARGLNDAGVEVRLLDSADVSGEGDLEGYDTYVFGSATYHGEMMQHAKQLLFLSDKLNLKGRAGGAFGAFGWSGEAPDRIFNTMRHILGMDMVEGPLRLKSPLSDADRERAREYGLLIAAKLGG
jgi:flavorubredoxin